MQQIYNKIYNDGLPLASISFHFQKWIPRWRFKLLFQEPVEWPVAIVEAEIHEAYVNWFSHFLNVTSSDANMQLSTCFQVKYKSKIFDLFCILCYFAILHAESEPASDSDDLQITEFRLYGHKFDFFCLFFFLLFCLNKSLTCSPRILSQALKIVLNVRQYSSSYDWLSLFQHYNDNCRRD